MEDVATLLAEVTAGDLERRWMLSKVQVAEARSILETFARTHHDPKLISQVITSLSAMAAPESWPFFVDLLQEGTAVVRYFARLATPEAVEVLAELLLDEHQSRAAAIALGALGDARAVEPLLQAAERPWRSLRLSAESPIRGNTPALAVLARMGRPEAVPRLVQILDEGLDIEAAVARRLDAHRPFSHKDQLARLREAQGINSPMQIPQGDDLYDPQPGEEQAERVARQEALTHVHNLANVLAAIGGGEVNEALAQASARFGEQLPASEYRPQDAIEIPDADRTLKAWTLDYETGDTQHPGTRFGGQPSWRDEPTWPLTPAGTPMSFWAQFEIPWEPEKMAYLFVELVEGDIADSDNDRASLFVQPGAEPDVAWIGQATGPVVPDTSVRDTTFWPPDDYSFEARVPSLREFYEPASWPVEGSWKVEQSWDKIGGTPLVLQGKPMLSPEWTFLFEFTAQFAGRDLGDVAHCYGYIDPEGNGYYYWDCH